MRWTKVQYPSLSASAKTYGQQYHPIARGFRRLRQIATIKGALVREATNVIFQAVVPNFAVVTRQKAKQRKNQKEKHETE